jgi:hypothetical protein
MRRFLWATPLLLVLISSGAWADSVSLYLAPNYGSGDNFGIEQQIGAMTVIVGGGTETGFFDGFPSEYAPGQTVGGFGTVYLDFGEAEIGGVSYDLNVTTGSLFMSSITLPTNGATTVTDLVELGFNTFATVFNTGQGISVGGSAKGTITFDLGYNGFYYAAGQFTPSPAPEPGTVGLIGTGLIGIFSVARRRLRASK